MSGAIARGVLVLTLALCGTAKSADAPDSYRSLTVPEFENEGPTLAAQSARVEISGAYTKPGNMDLLYADRASAVTSTENPENADGRRMPSISLLTDQASHGARAALVDCRTREDVGCQVTLRGQVTMCTITNSLGSSPQFPCLDVLDGGLVSSQVSPGLGLLERARPTTAAVAAPAPPAGTDSDATCYGYVGFVSTDHKFAVSVVGPFSSPTCQRQFDAKKMTVPSPFKGGKMIVSDHGNTKTIEATVRYGLHCVAVDVHNPAGLTGLYQCPPLGR